MFHFHPLETPSCCFTCLWVYFFLLVQLVKHNLCRQLFTSSCCPYVLNLSVVSVKADVWTCKRQTCSSEGHSQRKLHKSFSSLLSSPCSCGFTVSYTLLLPEMRDNVSSVSGYYTSVNPVSLLLCKYILNLWFDVLVYGISSFLIYSPYPYVFSGTVLLKLP